MKKYREGGMLQSITVVWRCKLEWPDRWYAFQSINDDSSCLQKAAAVLAAAILHNSHDVGALSNVGGVRLVCSTEVCQQLVLKKKNHQFQHTMGLKRVLSAEETEPWKKF